MPNIEKALFFKGTFNENKEIISQNFFDIVVCDQVITLMTKEEFNVMFKKLTEMDLKYLFISSRTNDYYGIVGGTMIAFKRIMRKYKNMNLIILPKKEHFNLYISNLKLRKLYKKKNKK